MFISTSPAMAWRLPPAVEFERHRAPGQAGLVERRLEPHIVEGRTVAAAPDITVGDVSAGDRQVDRVEREPVHLTGEPAPALRRPPVARPPRMIAMAGTVEREGPPVQRDRAAHDASTVRSDGRSCACSAPTATSRGRRSARLSDRASPRGARGMCGGGDVDTTIVRIEERRMQAVQLEVELHGQRRCRRDVPDKRIRYTRGIVEHVSVAVEGRMPPLSGSRHSSASRCGADDARVGLRQRVPEQRKRRRRRRADTRTATLRSRAAPGAARAGEAAEAAAVIGEVQVERFTPQRIGAGGVQAFVAGDDGNRDALAAISSAGRGRTSRRRAAGS